MGSERMSRDERVVAEARAALGDEDVRIAGADDLGDHVLHVPGREELPLLDVDDAPGSRRGDQEIRLTAKEGRDLQDVDGFGDVRALAGLMHVGENGHSELLADVGEDRERLVEAEPSLRLERGAVRLVERALVDEADVELAGELVQRTGHVEGVLAAFERARSGDQGELRVVPEAHALRGDERIHGGGVGRGHLARIA